MTVDSFLLFSPLERRQDLRAPLGVLPQQHLHHLHRLRLDVAHLAPTKSTQHRVSMTNKHTNKQTAGPSTHRHMYIRRPVRVSAPTYTSRQHQAVGSGTSIRPVSAATTSLAKPILDRPRSVRGDCPRVKLELNKTTNQDSTLHCSNQTTLQNIAHQDTDATATDCTPDREQIAPLTFVGMRGQRLRHARL